MSRASKFTLAATGLGTMGIVWFVHWAQEADRAVCCDFDYPFPVFTYAVLLQAMHKGVERDMEKQRVRLERQAEFEMQKALEQEYLKLQTVHSTTDDSSTSSQNTNSKS
jgi:protein PET117